MIIVIIIRWLLGYIDFEVTGRFPERFINLAAKKGINMWKLSGDKETFRASTKTGAYYELKKMAEKNQNEIHILKYHGLPYLLKKYSNRVGILIGLILFAAICTTMSGFIWNIKIDAPPEINEYEIRNELRDMGLTEGKWSNSIDTEKIEREIAVKNEKISWIAVNILGSDVEVVISGKAGIDNKNNNKNAASNIKSKADGTITRMEVRKGRSKVNIGDGVRKNQLLVSGILEYTDGTSSFVDSDAKIYAETSRCIEIKIPKNIKLIERETETVSKKDISVFGLRFPLKIGYRPEGNYIQSNNKLQAVIFEKTLPIYVSEEKFQKYKIQPVKLSASQAEKILNSRSKLFEVFILYGSEPAEIKSKTCSVSENKDYYIMKNDYITEENICVKNPILLE